MLEDKNTMQLKIQEMLQYICTTLQ